MKYKDVIEKMSLEEKASLCVGNDYWHSLELEKYGIPKITMSDGPHGLRVQKTKADNLGINESEISTCFPASASLGNTWNRELIYLLGKTLGKEARKEEVNIVLGPAINIKRSPLCGRNFEYFSEDSYLTGILGMEYVKGLQSENVGACVKHFAVNNQENRRRTIDVVIDERALREVYLKAFEMIIKNAKPWSIMSAYNKVNGEYCSENQHLLNDILRKEWNFDGIVISDWGAENDRVKGLKATHELEMPEVTEAQLELMKKLGVPMLDGMYRADASALIQHALDGAPLFPDRGLPRPILQFLIENKSLSSSWLTLSDLEDLAEDSPELRALIKNCK